MMCSNIESVQEKVSGQYNEYPYPTFSQRDLEKQYYLQETNCKRGTCTLIPQQRQHVWVESSFFNLIDLNEYIYKVL